MSNPCRTVEGRRCLIGTPDPSGWTCEICQSLMDWAKQGHRRAVLGCSRGMRRAYLCPIDEAVPSQWDDEVALMAFELEASCEDVRGAVNRFLRDVEEIEVWSGTPGEPRRLGRDVVFSTLC